MQPKHCCLLLFLFALLLAPFGAIYAQEESKDAESKEEAKDSKKSPKEKGYADFITAKAVTDSGLFIVHKVDEKYYFELPLDVLEKEILVTSRISGYVKNLSFGGAGMRSRPQQVIRWQAKDKRILLRSVSYNSVASEDHPIYQSVRNNNFEPVIMSFERLAFNADSTAALIEVGPLFTTDIAMIGPLSDNQRRQFGIKSLDAKRSFIHSVKAFPENVEVRHVLTFTGDKLPDNQLTGTLSVEMNQSFILLPDEPMQPRMYDARVGYFSIQQIDYGLDEHKAAKRRYITRWRLVPKDIEAYQRGELVEPVKPIVYYIDPATPEEWRPYLKLGVEDWQSAFEKAGFKNAILAKDPPSPEEDPDWSPEDVRYSVIRYVATEIQNAMGPHVHDPRTGEILESDIIWYHNVMNLLRNWFLIQTAAVNPDARRVKFDREVMGELIRFVAAHEVGHTLGLPHNMGSSAAYPVDSLRKAGFVQRMGVAPSIMDYARFNYVAQPSDEGAGLYPKIGPYDDWSIIFGYQYIPEADSPEAEAKIINEWVKKRADNPIYHYGQQQFAVVDPGAQTEDLSDDAVLASTLGIANLKRITAELVAWSSEEGKDYSELQELYGQVVGQLRRYAGHVGNNVGGVWKKSKTADEEGAIYTHVPKGRQSAAVEFLNQQIFQTPGWLINTEILARIQPAGAVDNIRSLQEFALGLLFQGNRLNRIAENEALNGAAAYGLKNLFDDTRQGIFQEVYQGSSIDLYRRNLQRVYIAQMGALMQLSAAQHDRSDIKAMARAALESLKKDLGRQAKRQKDEVVRAHLQDLLARIALIEEGKIPEKPAAPAVPTALEHVHGPSCWE